MAKRVLWTLAIVFVLVNGLAFRHARSFFFYASGSERTPAPEQLTWSDKARLLVAGIKVPKPVAHATPADVDLPFSAIKIPANNQAALPGWHVAKPDAAAVVLVFHGYSSEKSGMLPEARRFFEMGHAVVLIDFHGHGEAEGSQTTLGMREADDVAAALIWARAAFSGKCIILYGHSMGGAAVMRAMARYDARPDGAIVESVFDNLLEAIRFRFALMALPSFPMAEVLLFWGSVQLGVNGFAHDVVEYAADVRVPVLVAHGGADRRASVAGARAVYAALAGDKDWLLIEEAGHVNPCLIGGDRWKSAVAAFIDRIVARHDSLK